MNFENSQNPEKIQIVNFTFSYEFSVLKTFNDFICGNLEFSPEVHVDFKKKAFIMMMLIRSLIGQ